MWYASSAFGWSDDPNTTITNNTPDVINFTTGGTVRLSVANASTTLSNQLRLVFNTGAVVDNAITLNAQTGIIDFDDDLDGFVWTNSYITANSMIQMITMSGESFTVPISYARGSGTVTLTYTATGVQTGEYSFIIYNP